MHKNVNINNKMLSNADYEFFLQCWLPLSPYKTPKKAFYYVNNLQRSRTTLDCVASWEYNEVKL
jgi:hypothetical protein